MKNNFVSLNNRFSLGFAVFLLLSAASAQAFSWPPMPTMPWNTPGAQVADGCDNVQSGLRKVCAGITGGLYNVLASGVSATGLSSAWKNHREVTALTMTAAVALAYWATYKVGIKRGKKEMARAIARSVEDEQAQPEGALL